MATRLVTGTLREIWREVAPLIGGASQVVTTGIRANSVLLSNVFGILRFSPVGGIAILNATPSVVNGLLVVTITNTSANAAAWLLDVTLNHSIQQSRDASAVGAIHSISDGGVGGAAVPVLPNIAALRAFTETPVCVEVLGYYTPGDGGGGTFIWDVTSAAVDDGGLVIIPNTLPPVGRWLRSFDDFVTVRFFGAKGDGITDDTVAIQSALNSGAGSVYVPPTNDYFSVFDGLTVPDNTRVFGAGWKSIIRMHVTEKNIFTSGSQCTFDGLHLVGFNAPVAISFDFNNGIYTDADRHNIVIQNCFIEKCEAAGIQLRFTRNTKILNNFLFANPQTNFGDCADIVLYSSGVEHGRSIIQGNHCLSNNSQGIYVNALGGDYDIVIEGNICVTLDPATCTSGGAWTELAPATMERRHGIITSYAAALGTKPRCVVNGNICRNTLWTGVYKAGISQGPVIISNNVCSLNGYSRNSLCGGIYLNQSGGELVIGNTVFDFQGDANDTGCISVNGGGVTDRSLIRTLISGNVLRGSALHGISLAIASAHVKVFNNTISDCAGSCIGVIANPGLTDCGGYTIQHNELLCSVYKVSIIIDKQNSTQPIYVYDNHIVGFDSTTESYENTAIYFRAADDLIRVKGNCVTGFYYGIVCEGTFGPTRHANAILEGNELHDCAVGFTVSSVSADAMVPLVDNLFDNVGVQIAAYPGSGGVAGRICTREGNLFVSEQTNAPPANGTWIAGDRVNYTTPIAGGYVGAVCVLGGAPGTWKGYGAIAP